MTCESVQRSISRYLDGQMPEQLRKAVSLHMVNCVDCEQFQADLRYVHSSVRQLPMVPAPKNLAMKLRVTASYDRERRQGAGEFSSPWQRWLTRAKIAMRDLMRPLALPAAGGFFSSVLLFTFLVDTFGLQVRAEDDVPLGVYTQVKVDSLSPFGFTGRRDVSVELWIDKEGRVVGYCSHSSTLTRDEMNQLGNLVLFTSFNPATADGQPVSGKIVFNTSRINIRG